MFSLTVGIELCSEARESWRSRGLRFFSNQRTIRDSFPETTLSKVIEPHPRVINGYSAMAESERRDDMPALIYRADVNAISKKGK
jgi:hypothetical protein